MAEILPNTAGRGHSATLKILLVEDDENDVELLRLALKSASAAQLVVAFNGREAVEVILPRSEGRQIFQPDVILCDLKMPVMNGFEFLHWLKKESPCPRTPLIVLSSSVVEGDVGRSYDLGAAAYLVKPSSHDALQTLAKGLVNFWRLVQAPQLGRDDLASSALGKR